jgi:predicted ATPase/DNA-binding CsgD family transcriptional regulator
VTAQHGYRPLVGRARDVDDLERLLVDNEARLVTLVGSAGVGKTRLALAAADRLERAFQDGVVFVDLAPAQDASLVVPTIAQALDVPDSSTLAGSIGQREMLLVLDNFEQVASAAPTVGDLLSACPRLKVLVTSREPLAVAWEQLFDVAPLVFPNGIEAEPEAIGRTPAVALFVQQARAVRPGFTLTPDNARTIGEICRRLDGLPLGIELAAARMRVLSPQAILVQLTARPLQLLGGGARDAPERHRSLRGALAWSYGLLDAEQQTLFRQMAVFVGGFSAEALAAVSGATLVEPGLEALLDRHLLSVAETEHSDLVRYQPLETIREFGLELLQAAHELDAVREQHARYMAQVVERSASGLFGADQARSTQRLLLDYNNIRAALDWCARAQDPRLVELGVRLAGSLWLFWRLRGLVGEGRTWLSTLLTRAGVTIRGSAVEVAEVAKSVAAARALHAAGYLAFAQADAVAAHHFLAASLATAREVDDAWSQSYALHGLGHAALLQGDYPRARQLYAERLDIAEGQHDEYALGQALNALGEVARCLDEPSAARELYARSLQVRRRLGDTRGVAMGIINLGHVALGQRDIAGARAALGEGVRLLGELGYEYGEAVCAVGLAALAMAEGQPVGAARLLGCVEATLERLGNTLEPPDRRAFERTRALVMAALGSARFLAEFSSGVGLTMAEAMVTAPADAPSPSPVVSLEAQALSPREREVARLIARGKTSKEIGDALAMSERTADTHAAHIRDKLGLRSRAEIAAWAARQRL